MEYTFTRSVVVMGQLAKESSRTPPSEGNSPFEYIDRSLTILGRTSGVHSERMREEFLSQREFIAHQIKEVEIKVDGRFNEMEKRSEDAEEKTRARFKEADKMMDGRSKGTDKKIEEVDKKIEEVDKKMREYLNHIHNASRNILRTRGWEAISPVGLFDPQGGIHIPKYFPRTVRHFWKLKDPPQMHHLVYLVRFYNIQGYEEWGRDTDSIEGDSDSDNSSKSSALPIPLETAVRSYPEIAHRALAAQLGLAYDEIQRFMERAKELSQAQLTERNKRRQEQQTSEERKRRSFKMSPEEEGTEVTSPTGPSSSQGRTR